MVILMATLFWALWDEAFGQRPWKAFQSEWKDRYIAFLKTAKSKSAQSEKQVEQNSDYQQLEQAYEQAYKAAQPHRDELQKQITELGDVLKPVTEASTKASQYISDHMVELTPTQIDGLRKKTAEWDPKIQQINVADANIVDRCESCHMGAREPVKITSAVMTPKGQKKPDDYARAFVS